jgi:MFS family permease
MRHTHRVLWLIPAVYFVFVAGEFGALTYLALRATEAGESALRVGWLAGAMWAGILCASAGAHRISQRLGFVRTFTLGSGLAFVSVLSFNATQLHALWVSGAFVLGLGGGLVWVVGESWLAEAAPPGQRGRYVGWFEASVGLGLMAGPLLIPAAGALAWSPLRLATAVMAVALLASLMLSGVQRPGPHPLDPGSVAPSGPDWRPIAFPLVAVSVLSGMMEAGVSALLPSLSMRLGYPLTTAAMLGTVIGAGSALLQPPAGRLADHWPAPRLILACWIVLLATALGLLLWATHPGRLLWGVGFVLGGVGGAIYTLSIIEMGHRLQGGWPGEGDLAAGHRLFHGHRHGPCAGWVCV